MITFLAIVFMFYIGISVLTVLLKIFIFPISFILGVLKKVFSHYSF